MFGGIRRLKPGELPENDQMILDAERELRRASARPLTPERANACDGSWCERRSQIARCGGWYGEGPAQRHPPFYTVKEHSDIRDASS